MYLDGDWDDAIIWTGSSDEENISRWIEVDEKVTFEWLTIKNWSNSNEVGFYEIMAFEDRLVQMYVHSILDGNFATGTPVDDLESVSAIQKIARVQTGTLDSCLTTGNVITFLFKALF